MPPSGDELERTAPGKEKIRVIDSLWTFLVAVAVVGPFALPLLWRNPRYRVRTKVVASVLVIALTVALVLLAPLLTVYLAEIVARGAL